MINGFINAIKPIGMTSFEVVNFIKDKLKVKAGHLGTLDPGVFGVLPVAINSATKVIKYISDDRKEYIATLLLGISTDTEDRYGKITERQKVPNLQMDDIGRAIKKFKGHILQIPPMYSAKKVNGERLYKLAREGKIIKRKPIIVNIFEIELLNYVSPDLIKFRVSCSKGTYIRTLCADIAKELGTCGFMLALERLRSGLFSLNEAVPLDQIDRNKIIPMDSVFKDLDVIQIDENIKKRVLNGNKFIPQNIPSTEYVRIYFMDKFIALGLFDSEFIRVIHVFA